MTIILLIDLVMVGLIVKIALTRGLEEALPVFVFFATLLPQQESQIRVGEYFGLTGQRVALIVLFLLFLLKGSRSPIRSVPLKHVMWVHIAWVALSTFNSLLFSTSVKQMLAQILEYYLLYFIFVKTITQIRTVHKILYAMVGAMFVCCIFGLAEAYALWSVLNLFPQELWTTHGADMLVIDDRGLRLRSTFPHAIHYGDALALTIPIALYLLTMARTQRQKLFLWLVTILMFWNIYKTGTRGAWLALVGSLAVLFFVLPQKTRRYLVVIGVLAFAVLIIRPGVWQSIQNNYRATFDTETPTGASYYYRYELARTIREALDDQPTRAMWGFGLGSFRYLGVEGTFLGRPWTYYSCDSAWLLMMYETGYVGFLILALMLLLPAKMAFADYLKFPKPDRLLSLIFLASIGSFAFQMMSVALYGWGQNGHMLWLLIAAGVAYGKLRRMQLAQETLPPTGALPGKTRRGVLAPVAVPAGVSRLASRTAPVM